MRMFVALAVLALLPACGGSSTGSSGGVVTRPPPTAAPPAPENNTFAGLLNNARTTANVGTVTFDARLGRAAQGHADDMVANNFFDHRGSDGSDIGDRVAAQGYNYAIVGENIAQGQQTVQSAMTSWMNSAGHRRNNLDGRFEDFALGVAGTGSEKTWVLVLGAEQ